MHTAPTDLSRAGQTEWGPPCLRWSSDWPAGLYEADRPAGDYCAVSSYEAWVYAALGCTRYLVAYHALTNWTLSQSLSQVHLVVRNHFINFVCLFGFNVALTTEVILWRFLLVAVVLWPICSHTGMSCCRQDMTRHPVTVYRHGADLSLWYPLIKNVTLEYTTIQLMSWVRPDQDITLFSLCNYKVNYRNKNIVSFVNFMLTVR